MSAERNVPIKREFIGLGLKEEEQAIEQELWSTGAWTLLRLTEPWFKQTQ